MLIKAIEEEEDYDVEMLTETKEGDKDDNIE
jgi:hypothetical protein